MRSGTSGSVAQSRWLTLLLGVLAAAAACLLHDVIAAMTVAYDLLVGAVFVPIMGAVFFGSGSAVAALLSIIASAVVVVALLAIYGVDSSAPIYGGLAASVLACVGGSMSLSRRASSVS